MEEYLTVEEVANILKIGKNKAYTLVSHKDFPKITIGKAIRIPVNKFNEYINRYMYKTIDF